MSSLSGKQHVCATIPENVLKYRFFAVMCDIFPENMPTFVLLLPRSKDKSNAIKKKKKTLDRQKLRASYKQKATEDPCEKKVLMPASQFLLIKQLPTGTSLTARHRIEQKYALYRRTVQ